MLSNLFLTDPDWTQTILRTILGVVFFAHGAKKCWAGLAGPVLNRP
jgi:hypothetical protein